MTQSASVVEVIPSGVSLVFEEWETGGRRQSIPGKGQRGLCFLERTVKCGVEAGHPERGQGLRLVVWVQPHLF